VSGAASDVNKILRTLLDVKKIPQLPDVHGLKRFQEKIRKEVKRYKDAFAEGQFTPQQAALVDRNTLFWPDLENILRLTFSYYNEVIYRAFNLSLEFRDRVEAILENDDLGGMIRAMVELNDLLTPDENATGEEKKEAEERGRFRGQFEVAFGRNRFTGNLTDEDLQKYVSLVQEFRNLPFHGKKREVSYGWIVDSLESLQKIAEALDRNRVYPGIVVPFAFQKDPWGREYVCFWREGDVGEKDPKCWRRRYLAKHRDEILFRECMYFDGFIPPRPIREKGDLVWGAEVLVFTLDELKELRDRKVEDADIAEAITYIVAEGRLIWGVNDDPEAVAKEVEGVLRNRFRKRVVDRYFDRKTPEQKAHVYQRIHQRWNDHNRRQELMVKLTRIIKAMAISKGKLEHDTSLLPELNALIVKASPSSDKKVRQRLGAIAAQIIREG
jgi:hypothetical protein